MQKFKRVTNIFKEENFILREYYSNTNELKETGRIKLKVISKNEIILKVDLTGKNIPTFVEAVLRLPHKKTCNFAFLTEPLDDANLLSLEITTKTDQLGNEALLYLNKSSTSVDLKEDKYNSFKFNSYTNHNRAGEIKISCI